MTGLLRGLSLCLLVHHISVTVVRGEFLEPPPNHSVRSLAERETTLPCRYQAEPGESALVVQVTWYKKKPDGSQEQIIAAHHSDGQTAFGMWSGRVRFRGSEPTLDSSLVIMSTELNDEGKYTCHISTFPKGNFDLELELTVWTLPISSLEPVVLVEGQSYRLAASCRSVARPPARLSWDTELSGQSTNRTGDGGTVSTFYSLHPLRSMNGKKLDCLVWHPALEQPHRHRNSLVVHFPPNAEVSGYSQNWYVGLETAALRCTSGGNPEPQSFTWTRKGGVLPEGVIPHPNGTLEFGRPLSLADAGVYQCVAKNDAGMGKAEMEIKVTAEEPQASFDSMLLLIVGAVAGGLLLLMVVVIVSVTCHHRRKNRALEHELTVKNDEISTLVRQASIRRVNTSDRSFDIRGATEENIPLRVEAMMRTSLSSLGEQTRCRDSRSTLSAGRGVGGGGGGGMGLDYLGRPALHNTSRRSRDRAVDRDEEARLRVETYVRNSTMSLQETRLHPPLMPSPFPVIHSPELLKPANGSAIVPLELGGLQESIGGGRNQQHSPMSCTYPPLTDDEDEEDEGLGGLRTPQGRPDDPDSETNSSQVSDAQHPNNYQPPNGSLRSKLRPGPIAAGPHASFIHKAQIV